MDLSLGYYDISPEISGATAVFPGDTAFQRDVKMSFEHGSTYLLSSIQTTVHLGAHADAPNHYHPSGAGISERPLEPYVGLCEVIEVRLERGERITSKHLGGRKVQAPRVLFKTQSFPDPNRWNNDFNSLSPELIRELALQKVLLVGIDTPSVDPASDPVLHAHGEIYKNNLSILEGLVLESVPEGLYQLIALPLRIKDADASPVRAILMKRSLK